MLPVGDVPIIILINIISILFILFFVILQGCSHFSDLFLDGLLAYGVGIPSAFLRYLCCVVPVFPPEVQYKTKLTIKYMFCK